MTTVFNLFMKRILTLLLLCSMWNSVAQPVIRQSFTTNSSGKTPNILATTTNTIYPLMVLNPDGSGGDRSILFSEFLTLTGTNTTLGGNLSLNGRTNKLSIASDTLFLDGVAVGGGGGDTIWTNVGPGTVRLLDNLDSIAINESTGGIMIGPNAEAGWGALGPKDGLVIIHDPTAGDDEELRVNISAIKDVNVYSEYGEFKISVYTNALSLGMSVADPTGLFKAGFEVSPGTAELNMTIGASPGVQMHPGISDGLTAYAFDAAVSHTSGNLFELSNSGTNKFTIGYDGAITLGGQTNQVSDNGTALTFNGVAIGGGLATSASQYIIVGGAASGAANWTALSNAYVASAAATPNGAALASGNRYTVYLLPGVYDQGASSLVMTNNYVDLVGMSENTGIRVYNGTPNDADIVIKTSGTIGISLGAIDAWLINLCLEGTASTSRPYSPTSGTATHRLKNVYIVNSTANAIPNEYQGMPQTVYGGYYEDVRCWNAGSFSGEASGTFIRCKAGAYGFGHSGFGGSGIASGTFIDCEASFGFGSATASGMFLRCRTLPTSGTPNNQGFGTGAGATFSGMAIDCFSYAAGNAFAGNAGTMSGTLIGCGGGNPASSELALTGWSSVTGKVLGCNFVGYNFGTLNVADLTTSTNGFASFSTTTPVNIAATGWTNTFAKNATVFADGTTMTITVKNNAGTSVYTNTLAHTGAISIPLQAGGAVIISGTGVAGRAVPF